MTARVLSALALLVAIAALALTLTRPGDVADRIVVVSNATDKDDVDVKGIRADCPEGTLLLGGGSAIQHGHDTPSIALYMGFPEANGWTVQAHETDPEQEGRFPWTLQSIAVCVRK